jgi:hypothetical protein
VVDGCDVGTAVPGELEGDGVVGWLGDEVHAAATTAARRRVDA